MDGCFDEYLDGYGLKKKKESNTIINFGPQHPAAHGVLRLMVELDCETIEQTDVHIGLLHRGTEKLIEYKTYNQAIPYFGRLDYMSPLSQEHTFVRAIEKLLNLEVPIRAQWIRVLLLELTRISNHILNIAAHAMDVGATTPLLFMMEERDKILEFFDQISGARLHAAFFRPGGLHADVPNEVLDQMASFTDNFMTRFEDLQDLINNNSIFKQRLVDIGVFSKEQILQYAASGPVMRGSGIPWDLRRSAPYEVYSEIPFKIPIGKNGDCYCRYMVRCEEIDQSIDIVNYCLDHMPNGPVRSSDRKITPPKRSEMKNSMEAMICFFKLYSEGYKVPEGETYAATETPKGEMAVHLVSDGTNRPYRCKIRAPGFFHLAALDEMMQSHLLADIPSILGSLDIVLGEVDR